MSTHHEERANPVVQRSMIIIGMGPGNGRAIADRFGQGGYALGLVARSEARLSKQADELSRRGHRVSYHTADTSDLANLEEVILTLRNELEPIDVIIFNAYAAAPEKPSELPAGQLSHDLTVNVAAPLAAARAVLPGMRARGTGAILFTGGGLAMHPTMHAASLSVGKSAIRTLAIVLNEELKTEGIRAGTVTIAGKVGFDILASDVAEAFWAMSQERSGVMGPETVLGP